MKRIILLLLAVTSLANAHAQIDDDYGIVNVVKETTGDNTEVEVSYYDSLLVRTNSFLSNWEFLFCLGPQFSVGEDDPSAKFKDWITFPVVDVRAYKWVNPVFGAGLGMTYVRWKGIYGKNTYDIETFGAPDDETVFCDGNVLGLGTVRNGYAQQSRGHYMDVFLLGMVDLSNFFGGYKPYRRFHFLATFGGGFAFTIAAKHNKMSPSFNLGLHAEYDITSRWGLSFGARGMFLSDSFDGQFYETNVLRWNGKGDRGNLKMDGAFGLTVGINYSFGFQKEKRGYSKWVPMTRVVQTSVDAAYVPHTDEINQLHTETANVAAAATAAGMNVAGMVSNPTVAAQSEKLVDNYQHLKPQKEIIKEFDTNYRVLVNFVIDKWDISHREEIIIKHAAEFINTAPKDQKFEVIGYADVQTATPEHNMFLSKNRAEIVTKMLVEKYNVDRNRLNVLWVGGHDYLYFDDPQCTRSCIIRAVGSENMRK